jgi:hypothetical protein
VRVADDREHCLSGVLIATLLEKANDLSMTVPVRGSRRLLGKLVIGEPADITVAIRNDKVLACGGDACQRLSRLSHRGLKRQTQVRFDVGACVLTAPPQRKRHTVLNVDGTNRTVMRDEEQLDVLRVTVDKLDGERPTNEVDFLTLEDDAGRFSIFDDQLFDVDVAQRHGGRGHTPGDVGIVPDF